MKRTLFIASIIGLFMVTTLDLQARHGRNNMPRNVRSGIASGLSRQTPSRNRYNSYGRYDNRSKRHANSRISFGLSMYAPMLNRYNSYGPYDNYPGRNVAREIQMNEKRIWKLEKRINRLNRHEGNYREIRELEQEINYLERRNDFLRNQL